MSITMVMAAVAMHPISTCMVVCLSMGGNGDKWVAPHVGPLLRFNHARAHACAESSPWSPYVTDTPWHGLPSMHGAHHGSFARYFSFLQKRGRNNTSHQNQNQIKQTRRGGCIGRPARRVACSLPMRAIAPHPVALRRVELEAVSVTF